jgi:hypothetical protein
MNPRSSNSVNCDRNSDSWAGERGYNLEAGGLQSGINLTKWSSAREGGSLLGGSPERTSLNSSKTASNSGDEDVEEGEVDK